MSRSLKTITFAIGASIGLVILSAIALFLFLDVNSYKPRFEAAISDAFGMDVKVDGRLGVGFFPRLLVTLNDVHIRNRGTEVATARQARIGVDFLTLLRKGVQIKQIALEHPIISIERDRDGHFNFENSEESRGPLPNLNLATLSLSDGTLRYVDKESGEGFEAGNCKLDMSQLQLSGRDRPGIMKQLSFAAEIACGQIRSKNYAASDLKASIAGQRGSFILKPLTMSVFGGQGSGSIGADFTGAVPLYHVSYSISRLRIDEFLKTLSPQKIAEGSMDFSADLSMQGKTMDELRRAAEGQISLQGKNLILDGRDLDREFARYESSQHFNLVDVGAYVFLGPWGLLATKGYNFAHIFHGSGGRSEISTLVSDWKVDRGVAHAQDVAMATNRNRVALHGGLDFVNERFADVTFALIDAKGCAKVRQRIRGSFQNPVIEKPSTLKSIAGPVRRLVKQVRNLFPGGECEVFYAGSVAAPK